MWVWLVIAEDTDRERHGRTPDGGEGAWFKDSEGNLVGAGLNRARLLPGRVRGA